MAGGIWRKAFVGALLIHLLLLIAVGIACQEHVRENKKEEIKYVEVSMNELFAPQSDLQSADSGGSGGASSSESAPTSEPAVNRAETGQSAAAKPAPDAAGKKAADAASGDHGKHSAGGGSAGQDSGQGRGAAGGSSDNTGHGAKQVPRVIAGSRPVYPDEARRNAWEGRVYVKLLISASGTVEDASLSESSGYECLDQAAVSALQTWQFSPARNESGQPVAAGVIVPVRFNLKDAD